MLITLCKEINLFKLVFKMIELKPEDNKNMEHDLSEGHIKKQWDGIYRREEYSKHIQEAIQNVVDIFKKYNVKTILDLACGSGMHAAYLAERGFEIYGIDISEEAIKIAESLLEEKQLHANLIVGSIYRKLPYDDNFFDAVVCFRALYHERIEVIRGTIGEIKRILKPNGLVFVTARKIMDKRKKLPYKYIAPRTYAPLEGEERGLIHYNFNKKLLKKEFKNYKILDIWKEEKDYYCLLGKT